eukprot:GHVT01076205.1.p1 GENE.GHVT01076205.1~~GHVT01076205.1.p1  ORF type:complete len:347 (-),score=69.04 GHVT01076205.1:1390-2430(-)
MRICLQCARCNFASGAGFSLWTAGRCISVFYCVPVFRESKAASTMDALTFSALEPGAFHGSFLAKNIRPDGRGVLDYRKPHVTRHVLQTADGSAAVRCGKTAILACVRCELRTVEEEHQQTPRNPSGPQRGREDQRQHAAVAVTVQLPQGAAKAAAAAAAAPVDGAGGAADAVETATGSTSAVQFLEETVNQILNQPNFLNPETFQCPTLRRFHFRWVLHVDLLWLSCDGNSLDMALLAAVAALEDTTIPSVVLDLKADLWWRKAVARGPAKVRPVVGDSSSSSSDSVSPASKQPRGVSGRSRSRSPAISSEALPLREFREVPAQEAVLASLVHGKSYCDAAFLAR